MFTALLTDFASWLAGSWLNLAVASHGWVVPTLPTIHILGVAVVLSGVLLMNLRIVGLAERGQSIAAVFDRFLWPVTIAVAVLALTGVLLIVGEPTRAMFRTVFWVKMALIVLALALTWSQRPAFAHPGDGAVVATPAHKAVAVVTLFLWLGVIVAGRWIAYVEAWPGAPA